MTTYRRAVEAFARIRQNFWQPALAGSYLHGPARIFDRIILLASTAHAAEDALLFIEGSKASTLLGQLLISDALKQDSTSQELNDREAEILFLQDQLRTSLDMPLLVRAKSDYRQIRISLGEKTKQYDALKARLERKVSHRQSSVTANHDGFDPSLFRELANRALGKDWIALDYYLLEDRLVTILLAPDQCEVLSTPISHRFRMALEACRKAGQNPEPPTQGDLDVLGKTLVSSLVTEHLTPETFLLLAPHKELHTIPWAALQPEFSSKPLVHLCLPTVVPSLQSLRLIWQRKEQTLTARENGLVVGLSSFDGKRRELPHVKDEITFLSARLGANGQCLTEKDAAWENLLKLNQISYEGRNEGLSRFAWLHIASHFFSHTQTGRLSGLTLWDGDVWLDQLRDLAPLPELVTLSACNSISSFVYEGDEHVDLPSTCLVAGADRVVGSLWPVLDRAAAEFTSMFCSCYLEGMSPAKALVQTQRMLMDRGGTISHWAGFLCIGAP